MIIIAPKFKSESKEFLGHLISSDRGRTAFAHVIAARTINTPVDPKYSNKIEKMYKQWKEAQDTYYKKG